CGGLAGGKVGGGVGPGGGAVGDADATNLTFTAITLSAGLLAGVALRAALATLSVAGRACGATVLACLALVLAVTCMVGRTLLAGSLGLHPAFSDWLVLFAAIAVGLAVAELLSRLA